MTLLLLAVVAALGAILWFTDRQPPAKVSVEIAALDGRSLTECKRLRWQFTNLQPIEMTRGTDGAFWLAEPLLDLASHAQLKGIVHAWDTARLLATGYQDDFPGRKETGLDPPAAAFLAEWPDGHQIKIDIGGPGPIGSDCFLRRDGKIWRGGNALLSSLRVNLDDLRERAVFRTMEPQCTALRVEQQLASGKREVLHLQRGGQEWRMQAPLTGRTEQVAAVQFVTAVLALDADQFLPGHVRQRAGEPDIRILVRGAYGEETLDLWEDTGAAIGQLPGRTSWFQSDHRPYAAVFVNAVDNLRAKVLVPMDNVAQKLAEVVIDPGQGRGDRIHLVRDSAAQDWRLVEPVNHPAHPTPCNELVQAINNLRAIEFVDGATAADEKFGLGPTRLLVAVREFEQKEALNLWLGANADRTDLPLAYACRADETGTVVLVPRPALEQLQKSWVTYCARDVVKLSVPIDRLELRRGQQARTFRPQGGHWGVEGVEGQRDEVGSFVDATLRDLRGTVAVDLRNGAFGEPDWTLDLCRENRDVLLTLRIWDRSKDAPLVVQSYIPQTKLGDVGFEVAAHVGKALREFWQ